jgi:hypothetical protein
MNYQSELILEDVKYNINKLKNLIENFNNLIEISDDMEIKDVTKIKIVSYKIYKL